MVLGLHSKVCLHRWPKLANSFVGGTQRNRAGPAAPSIL